MPRIIFLFHLVVAVGAQDAKFEIPGATIKYEVKSSSITGTRLVAFDYDKKLMRIEVNYTVIGKAGTDNEVFIMRNDTIFQLDLEEKTFMNVSKSQQSEHFPWVESQMVFSQGKNLGVEMIKNLQTNVWIASADKYWIHKGLILKKSVTETQGRNTYDLAKLDLNVPSEDNFTIPRDFKEVEDPMSAFLDDLFGDD